MFQVGDEVCLDVERIQAEGSYNEYERWARINLKITVKDFKGVVIGKSSWNESVYQVEFKSTNGNIAVYYLNQGALKLVTPLTEEDMM